MKKYAILAAAVAAVLVFIPAAMCSSAKKAETPGYEYADNGAATETDEVISVFMPDENSAVQMTMRDYIIGCVAAEMPAEYEREALCAQALACVTLARYMQLNNNGKKELDGAVISADSKKYQGYMSVEEMRSRWDDDFEGYYEKLCDAVDEVIDLTVLYNGVPAMTAFHAISPGFTEDAANVWDKAIPYLTGVESEWDESSPKYLTTAVFEKEEIIKKLSPGELGQDAALWASDESYTRAGTLRSIKIGEKTYTGEELRTALELRSPAITVSVKDGQFIFEVRGYGHGVGMSQYGANCLAKDGCGWREIAEHYYPGTQIAEWKAEI